MGGFFSILGQTNLALYKECRQSSTHSTNIKYLPGVAVDGDTQQYMSDGALCSHTNHHEPFNWWTVDLGQQYIVDNITIYNRADSCCGARLHDYDVLIYSPAISTWQDYNKSIPYLCYHHYEISPLVIDITCRTGIVGRYVQIYKENGVDFNITNQPLTLCEVEVYGRNLTDPNDTVIEITTGNSISTNGIKLNQSARLHDYDALIYSPAISTWQDYNKSIPYLCYHHYEISPLVINITCRTGIIGRYVQIYKENGVDFNITNQPLTLCEVEVYGRNLTDPNDTVIEITTGNSITTNGIKLNQSTFQIVKYLLN
ncbi:unnamed protein product [Mytilus coruscus]|uniref:Fucolectin tachylectin-4 pentraxin-1 domain-containing protein n=1 Tax=Mytilus coruscus TaxID=42192 RepID=A0A6J8BGN8_MYTCO|nr:unnamed protein product [Mytilus coruscus]